MLSALTSASCIFLTSYSVINCCWSACSLFNSYPLVTVAVENVSCARPRRIAVIPRHAIRCAELNSKTCLPLEDATFLAIEIACVSSFAVSLRVVFTAVCAIWLCSDSLEMFCESACLLRLEVVLAVFVVMPLMLFEMILDMLPELPLVRRLGERL